MMKRTFAVLVLCLLGTLVSAQEGGILSFTLKPSLNIPLGTSAGDFSLGAGGELVADYTLPFFPLGQAIATVNYNFCPTVIGSSVNTLAVGLGGGVTFQPVQNLFLGASAEGGVFTAIYGTEYSLSGYLQVNGDVSYSFVPAFSIGAGVSYKLYFGAADPLLHALSVSLGTSLHLGKQSNAKLKINAPALNPVFPVLFKYYDDNPLGTVSLKNEEDGSISNVKVSVFVKQYMSSPKQCASIAEIRRGETKEIPLYALFTEQVLGITEKTKVQMDITVDYVLNKTPMTVRRTETLNIMNRNAMTWDDNRKVAAFVTRMDPAVLSFSKKISGLVRDNKAPALDKSFLIAMGLHEALYLYGLTYTPDPTTPFVSFSKEKTAVDFLQFPNQTLQYKAGDCDDLSILYNALLESVGVETAFITVPGHIYAAFALDAMPEELPIRFTGEKQESFIIQDGKVWMPVEVTSIKDGFLKAWHIGAEEWVKAGPSGEAKLHPTHGAWEIFDASGFQSTGVSPALPDEKKTLGMFQAERKKFVDMQIQSPVAELQKQIRDSKKDPRYVNKLGTLYARYGMFAEAEAQYAPLVTANYAPAVINMGNVQFLKNDTTKALTYYQKALKAAPKDARILINMALVYLDLGKYDESKKYYVQAKDSDPTLAGKYLYIETAQDGLRGADTGSLQMEWYE